MPTQRIEHAVPDFTGWKRAFDRLEDAEGLLTKMRRVWGSGEGQKVMRNPQARIADAFETIEL